MRQTIKAIIILYMRLNKTLKKALLRQLSDQQSRIDTSYNKINAFTTIIVAIIPIAVTFIDWDTIKSMSVIGMTIFYIIDLCKRKLMCLDFFKQLMLEVFG